MSRAQAGMILVVALALGFAVGPRPGGPGPDAAAAGNDPVPGDWAIYVPQAEGPAVIGSDAAIFETDSGLQGGTNDVAAAAARPKTAEITVTYHDFPAPAEAAFEAAVAIWETLLTSDAEILVTANWTPLEGFVARSRGAFRTRDAVEDPDLPLADIAYPAALAGAIRGHRVDDRADVEVDVSSTVENWYFGTDGLPAAEKLDLETVAMHELAHGFGFSTRATPSGFTGANPLPSVFDHFVVSGTGTPITMLSPAGLTDALTSNDLFFTGTKAKKAAGGRGVALYAPAPFAAGSSVGHLAAPGPLDAMTDRLLAPNAFNGYALHDPGPVVMSILADLGWEVSGVGQPARFKFNLVSHFWVEGQGHPMDIRVNVLDPFGDPVAGDNTTNVSLHLFATLGGDDDPGWGCNSVYTKKVTAGVAVFPGCYIRGTGHGYFKAVDGGLADGWSPFMVMAEDVFHVRVPMVVR